MRMAEINILEEYLLDQNHMLGESTRKVLSELAYRGAVILEVNLQTGRMFVAHDEYGFLFASPKCKAPPKLRDIQRPFLEKALEVIFNQNANLTNTRTLLLAGGVQYVGVNFREMTCRLIGADYGDALNYSIVERSWVA